MVVRALEGRWCPKALIDNPCACALVCVCVGGGRLIACHDSPHSEPRLMATSARVGSPGVSPGAVESAQVRGPQAPVGTEEPGSEVEESV